MSYTEIYRITKAGNTIMAGEIQNSWRGAMAVWNILEDRYLPPKLVYGMKISRMSSFSPADQQEVWDLVNDTRLTESEKIVLQSTFDNVLVLKDDIYKLTKAFREFNGNTSLPEQADLIEQIATHKNCWAICWNQTSVNADIPPKNVKEKYWNLFS
jgi:hypothetical protein